MEEVFCSANGKKLSYLYHAPESKEKLPLIFYIHGAGSRGNCIEELKENPGVCGIMEKARDKAIIAAPQCHCDTWFELYEALLEFIEEIKSQRNVDQTRVYITGASMGGYTAWQLCMSRPEWFAAAVPICGGGMYWNAARLKNLPVWAFHGALDPVVLPTESLNMVRAINQNGGNAKITIFPETEHNAWDPAYRCEEMWDWLFLQQKEGE